MNTNLRKERTRRVRREGASVASNGVTLGVLVGLGSGGEPWVDYPDNSLARPLRSRTTVPLGVVDLGREVALVFEADDRERPVILGVIRDAATAVESGDAGTAAGAAGPERPVVTVDGTQIVLSAEREIVLRCGEASLTLTRAGKILLRGRYVSSRSTGVNRILGGAVRIN